MALNIEVWRDVAEYRGLYEVSNHGRVRSLGRYVNRPSGKVWKPGRVLKPTLSQAGKTQYARVSLYGSSGKVKKALVHRLVATAYVDNPEQKPYVNHIDNNGANNLPSNLEWCTQRENVQHAIRQGRASQPPRNDLRKPVLQFHPNGTLKGEHESVAAAATAVKGCSRSIGCAASGKYKTASGFHWKYKGGVLSH